MDGKHFISWVREKDIWIQSKNKEQLLCKIDLVSCQSNNQKSMLHFGFVFQQVRSNINNNSDSKITAKESYCL